MKAILMTLLALALVGGLVGGGLFAYFSDTETSEGNTFVAGTIGITVVPTQGTEVWYEGSARVYDLKPCQTGWIEFKVENVGGNELDLYKHVILVDITNNGWTEPECEACARAQLPQGGTYLRSDVYGDDCILHYKDSEGRLQEITIPCYECQFTSGDIWFDMTINEIPDARYPEPTFDPDTGEQLTAGAKKLSEVEGMYIYLGPLATGDFMMVLQSFHMDPLLGNIAQSDVMTFDEEYVGMQIGAPIPVDPNTIRSSTMWFKGQLDDTGSFIGTIPMVNELALGLGDGVAGFDVYAKEGSCAYVLNYYGTGSWNCSGPDTATIGVSHDAYGGPGPWGPWYDPDCADWDQYSLELTADHWYLRYTATGESPMSGTMDWGNMYAAETDQGTVDPNDDGLPPYGVYALGGPQMWDWDAGAQVERIPLELPGFAVTVTPTGVAGEYLVSLTPANP